MHKIFFLKIILILILILSYIEAKDNKSLQIIAKNIEVKNSIINANGKVLVFSPHYYISANRIIYDKDKQTLELFENVNVSKNQEAISVSNYAFIDMKNELKNASPILLIDKNTDIWIDAFDIKKTNDLHNIKDATLSSCNCINPSWSIGFSSGDYNTTEQWVNLYNNTLYFKDIPAWYFLLPLVPYISVPNLIMSYFIVNPPYAGFSTNNNRQSGILKPKIGYSKSQGYFYEQPIFYAPDINYDFEYIPKIRSRRGTGHELKYRYKDSISSQLNMSTGFFIERDTYFKDESLENKKHYGWNVDYKRTNLFSNNESSDGLNISLQDMNDIEYKNTKYEQDTISSDKVLKSEITYFYNTNNYYFDTKIQKYDDITIDNNKKVFQTLPKMQVHKYSNKFFDFNDLTASFDFKFHNKSRKEGISAQVSELIVPINYSTYLSDDYLNISFTEQFKFKNINYKNTNSYERAYDLSNKHILNISTDLLKPYSDFIHTVNFNASFTKIHTIKRSDDLYGINSNDTLLSSFENSDSLDNIEVSLNQNFYLKNNKKNIINHKLSQSILDNNESNKLGNLENELSLYFKNGSFINRTLYNHIDKMAVKSTFAFKYKDEDSFLNMDYSYSKDKNILTNSYKKASANKSITAAIGIKVLKYYTIKYKEQYDISNDIVKVREYGININKKCWEFDLKLSDTLIASATTNDKARRQNIIYATITLKPLITLKQKYIQDEREE